LTRKRISDIFRQPNFFYTLTHLVMTPLGYSNHLMPYVGYKSVTVARITGSFSTKLMQQQQQPP